MIRAGLCILAFTVAARSAEKSNWEYAAPKDKLRVAFVTLRGAGPSGPCDATLVFTRDAEAARKPVRKDNSTIPPIGAALWLTNAKQAAPFDFNDFEGPDAVSSEARLVAVSLTAKGKTSREKWRTSGWYSPLLDPTGRSTKHRGKGDPEAFVFALGDVMGAYRDLLHLADALAAGADAFTIEIAGVKKGSAALRFDVPLAGASDALKQLLATKQ